MTRPDARALRKLILCATICAVDFAGLAQEPANIEHEIADYCAGRLAYANQHLEAALFVSAIPRNSDPTRDRWRRAISPQDFAAARKNGDSIAILWFLRRKLVWADFAFQNQFGDWINQTTYCYRSDGSLALLDSELKSFHGGLRVVRDSYYAPGAALLSQYQGSWDLGTGKPEQVPPGFWDQAALVFLHASDLLSPGIFRAGASRIPQSSHRAFSSQCNSCFPEFRDARLNR